MARRMNSLRPVNSLRRLGLQIAQHQDGQLREHGFLAQVSHRLETQTQTDALDSEGIAAWGQRIATEQDAELKLRWDRQQVRARLQRQVIKRRRPPLWILAPVGAVAAAAAVLVAVWVRQPDPSLTFAVSADPGSVDAELGRVDTLISAAPTAQKTLRFSDGSAIDLERGARARVERLRARGAVVALERGRAAVRVKRRRDVRWQLRAGPFEVRVVGTQFGLSWEPEQQVFALRLKTGKVVVDGPLIEGRALVSGQSVKIWLAESRMELGREPSRVSTAAPRPDETLAAKASPEVTPQTVPPERPRWRPARRRVARSRAARHGATRTTSEPKKGPSVVAQAGSAPSATTGTPMSPAHGEQQPTAKPAQTEQKRPPSAAERLREQKRQLWDLLADKRFGQAFRLAQELGWSPVLASASASRLMALGDAARFSGDTAAAQQAYKTLRRRFAASSQAPSAAFTLGRIAFDRDRDYAAAIRWFGRYLAERPSGSLARVAAGRQLEAFARLGSGDKACDAARTYLKRYPGGPHEDLAHRLSRRCRP